MRRPKVISNFAMTADGKVSTRNHTPSGFTSQHDKRRLLEIRSLGDAVMVGRGTAEADNMTMTIPVDDLRAERLARGQSGHPIRVLLSHSGDIPPTLKVFTNNVAPTLIYTTDAIPVSSRVALESHAQITAFPEKKVPLRSVLDDLRTRYQVKTLICEGGPTLIKSLFADDLLDELFITIAPKIFGGKDAPTMTGLPGSFLPNSRQFRLKSLVIENDEAYCHYIRS